ncbi:hypothetical protein BGZ83_002091 [Gryganskiella cystojenkinii]|nr:hypothetical protein BGZ83_002091 [Gryganskiella cystojenkinii]
MGSSATVIGGEYLVLGKIGEGSFGEVFRATHTATGVDYAIKREAANAPHPQLPHEAKMYERLAGGAGIPHKHWYGREGAYNALVIDLLGPNLKQVRRENEKFPLSFVIELGVQMISQLEFIHEQGVVYRDVKPENFLLDVNIEFPAELPSSSVGNNGGNNNNNNQNYHNNKALTPPLYPDHPMSFFNDTRRRQYSVESSHTSASGGSYLSTSPTSPIALSYGKPKLSIVDFGLATSYRDPVSGKHLYSKGNTRHKVGTARYASLNIHNGREHSRRDDIESVGYMLLEFLIGTLPWSGISAKNSKQGWAKMKEIKEEIELDELCEGLPKGFMTFIGYARGLKFDETPDYEYLRGVLTSSAGRGTEAQTVRCHREPAYGIVGTGNSHGNGSGQPSRSPLENCFGGLHIQHQNQNQQNSHQQQPHHPVSSTQEIPIKKNSNDPWKNKATMKDSPLENWRKRYEFVPAEKNAFQEYNPESLWTTTPPDAASPGDFSFKPPCSGSNLTEELKDHIQWDVAPLPAGYDTALDPSLHWGDVQGGIGGWARDDYKEGEDDAVVPASSSAETETIGFPPFHLSTSFPGEGYAITGILSADAQKDMQPNMNGTGATSGLGLQFARQPQHSTTLQQPQQQQQHAPQDARLYSNEPPFGLLPPSARVAAFMTTPSTTSSTVPAVTQDQVAVAVNPVTVSPVIGNITTGPRLIQGRTRQYSREHNPVQLGINTNTPTLNNSDRAVTPVHPLAQDSSAAAAGGASGGGVLPLASPKSSLSSSFSSMSIRAGQEVEPGIEHSQRGYPKETATIGHSPVKHQHHHYGPHPHPHEYPQFQPQDRHQGGGGAGFRSHRHDSGWEGDRDRWRPNGPVYNNNGSRPTTHSSVDGPIEAHHEWNNNHNGSHGRRSRQVSAPGSRFQSGGGGAGTGGGPPAPQPTTPTFGGQRSQWGIPPFGQNQHHPQQHSQQPQQSYPPHKYQQSHYGGGSYDQNQHHHSQGGGNNYGNGGYGNSGGGGFDQRRRSSRSRKYSNTSLQETFKNSHHPVNHTNNNNTMMKSGGGGGGGGGGRGRPK